MEGIALCGAGPIGGNSRMVQSSGIHCGIIMVVIPFCVSIIEYCNDE